MLFSVDSFFRMLVYACRGFVFHKCLGIKTSRGLFTSLELSRLNDATASRYDITRVFCAPTPRGLLYVITYNLGLITCFEDWRSEPLLPSSM